MTSSFFFRYTRRKRNDPCGGRDPPYGETSNTAGGETLVGFVGRGIQQGKQLEHVWVHWKKKRKRRFYRVSSSARQFGEPLVDLGHHFQDEDLLAALILPDHGRAADGQLDQPLFQVDQRRQLVHDHLVQVASQLHRRANEFHRFSFRRGLEGIKSEQTLRLANSGMK